MAVINYQAELNEIAAYLAAVGISENDHYLILDKLKNDQAAHLRYLQTARAAKTKH